MTELFDEQQRGIQHFIFLCKDRANEHLQKAIKYAVKRKQKDYATMEGFITGLHTAPRAGAGVWI